MNENSDSANVLIPPPIAWAIAFVIGLGLGWLHPLPFLPPALPHVVAGIVVFAAGILLVIWAFRTMRKAGTRVEPYKPTTAIVASGPFGFSRNPIYSGMVLGLIGLAVGFDNLWILVMLVPFYLVIRFGVIAREEAYLERKFGTDYLGYKARVRRWL